MNKITATVAEAREASGLGRTTIFALLASGELERVKVGRRTLITVASLQNLLSQEGQ
jgi:excisionase family DNA binding protein